MVEMVKREKDRILEFMDQEVGKYGNGRMDVKQIGELADIIKDLAQAEKECCEAEYYRIVSEAMEQNGSSSGHTSMRDNHMPTDTTSSRRGYGSFMDRSPDPMVIIRSLLDSNPELRKELLSELM